MLISVALTENRKFAEYDEYGIAESFLTTTQTKQNAGRVQQLRAFG